MQSAFCQQPADGQNPRFISGKIVVFDHNFMNIRKGFGNILYFRHDIFRGTQTIAMPVQGLRINTEITMGRTSPARKQLDRRIRRRWKNIISVIQIFVDKRRGHGNIVQIFNKRRVQRRCDSSVRIPAGHSSDAGKIPFFSDCHCSLQDDFIIFMTGHQINCRFQFQRFQRRGGRMRSCQHDPGIRTACFHFRSKSTIAVNTGRTGIQYEQFCIRCFLFHALQCLRLVQLLGRGVNKGNFKAVFLRQSRSVNQPERIVKDSAVTNGRTAGFSGKFAIF